MTEEALPPVSKEVIQEIWKILELDESRLKEAVDGIKQWLAVQPHLPKEEDDGRLERWLIRCKNSMEKTKKTLDMYYTLKTITPELMGNWDVNERWFNTVAKHGYGTPMPELTKYLDRVTVYGLFPTEDKGFDFWDFFKMVLMEFEIRMREDYSMKDIFVVDFKNFTLGHVAKFTLPLMKKFELCMMSGYHCRMKAIHYVNTPSYCDVVIAIVKSVFKSKLVSRIHVYGNDLTELYKEVPRDQLPEELGGTAGPVKEHWDRWQKKLKSYRDWFVARENMKSEESKRPIEKVNSSELFGFEGSFRKLNMD